MTEFLTSLSPDDEVGMVFVGHSDLSRNITRDPGQLVEAIKNVRAAFGFGLGTGMTPPGALPIEALRGLPEETKRPGL